jgi:hypothetical protein
MVNDEMGKIGDILGDLRASFHSAGEAHGGGGGDAPGYFWCPVQVLFELIEWRFNNSLAYPVLLQLDSSESIRWLDIVDPL